MQNIEPPDLSDYCSGVSGFMAMCDDAALKTLDAKQRQELSRAFLRLLIIRDRIAAILLEKKLAPEAIERVATADQELKKHASSIVQCVGADSFRHWSESGLIPSSEIQPTSWWWKLDQQGRVDSPSFFRLALNLVIKIGFWLVIAVSLSYIVEIARRFVGSGTDAPSVVTQGFLALLVGGTLVQFARQLVEGTTTKTTDNLLFNIKSLSVLAGALLLLVIVIYKAQPSIAAYYSNQGVDQRRANNYAEAIKSLRRATDMNPKDALAHFNLGVAYQQTKDYDNAEAEFRSALKWDRAQYWAYAELARLAILRRSDYAEALRLAQAGLNVLDNQNSSQPSDNSDQARNKYQLLVMRAWAFLGLQLYRPAESSLDTAINEAQKAQDPITGHPLISGAEAYCLKGKLLDSEAKTFLDQKNSPEAQTKKVQSLCAFLTCRQRNSDSSQLEPDLFGLMQERIATMKEATQCER
jgi:tetratricopeptide (TPR) repeat protein